MIDHPPRDVFGIVLAGGLGTRLQTVRTDCPKPLIPCLGRPFIEWVLGWHQRAGITEFIVSLGHLSEIAQRYFAERGSDALRISTVVEPHPLGTGGAIRFAWQAHPKRPALVCNGDSLLLADYRPLYEMWNTTDAEVIVVGVPQSDASRYGTLTFTPDRRLTAFEEKRPGEGIVNAGIYLFRPHLLATIPPDVPLSLERDVFPEWLRAGRDLRVCTLSAPFLDIGLPESLASADDFLKRHWREEQTP